MFNPHHVSLCDIFCRSEEHKGLFLLSFLGAATVSLPHVSSIGKELIQQHLDKTSDTCHQGLKVQYELQKEKLSKNIAGLEIVSMPVFVSRPSTSTSVALFVGLIVDTKTHRSKTRNT